MASTTNYSWTTPDDTDLVKYGASAIRTLGSAIDTTVFTNAGAAIQKSIVDAAGDLIYATADDTPARLAIGTAGQVLQVNSGATAPEWATPAGGGGKVLQVVSATTTSATTIASTTKADTGITATITPSAATSKILVIISAASFYTRNQAGIGIKADILRGATNIGDFDSSDSREWNHLNLPGVSVIEHYFVQTWNYLDSPNTTSATTYKLQAAVNTTTDSGSCTFQKGSCPSTITLMEIGA